VVAGEAHDGDYDFAVARYEGGNAPTAVTLAGFSVDQKPGRVIVSWQTAQEIDLLGFNLYRSSELGGERQRLNGTLIVAQWMGGLGGTTYEFDSAGLAPGSAYYYWLEVVSMDGDENYGPVSVVGYHWTFVPLIVR
jgi:hypothetical protein